MNKTIKNVLICLLLLFIACYVNPPDLALALIIVIGGFVLLTRMMKKLEQYNHRLALFFSGVIYTTGMILTFTNNDYIMFFLFVFFNLGLIVECLWFQPKEIIVKIVDVNKDGSV